MATALDYWLRVLRQVEQNDALGHTGQEVCHKVQAACPCDVVLNLVIECSKVVEQDNVESIGGLPHPLLNGGLEILSILHLFRQPFTRDPPLLVAIIQIQPELPSRLTVTHIHFTTFLP